MKLKGWVIATIGGTILLVAAALFVKAVPKNTEPYSNLSVIVLVGLALTVFFMAILVIVYAVLGMEDKTQPLGLPEGSVRALLAFSLVLIFVCLAAFLFTSVNERCDNCGKTLARVRDTELSDLKKDFRVAAEQAKDDSGKLLYEQLEGPKDSSGKAATIDDLKHPIYSVTYYPKQNADASDFAKQIFTTLATIFVSVVSFYFGSSVTASAVSKGADAARGPDGDRRGSALQAALTTALADSHNARTAVDQATADLEKAQGDLKAEPSDPQKQTAVTTTQKRLDDAKKDLEEKQAKVQGAQNAANEAKSKGGSSTTS
jgi:hypothetical protein